MVTSSWSTSGSRARSIPERAHKSQTGTLKGKYGYMSPEQVLEQPLDARSDLFSVGVVLAEMLTGRRLFAAANELDVLLMVRDAKLTRFDKYGEDVEVELAAVVRKALAKPLDERWQSAAEFRDALAEWMFDHRYRVASKQIADMVAELHPLIVERRAYPDAAAVEGSEGGRAPAEDGAPQVILGGADSMPIMSVSYEPEAPAPGVPAHASSASDLAAAADIAFRRVETVSVRPLAVQVPPLVPSVVIPPAPLRAELPRLGGAARFDDGVIQAPVADPISRAVSAVTLPHSFDELTEEPPGARSRDIQLPTAEEVARSRRPIPPALADIAEPPDDAGNFAVTSPLRVLFSLLTARATGLLVVTVGGIKKDLYVRNGQPEHVSSNIASELLGNYLVSKGVLSDGELAMALAMMPHFGGKLGDTLVGLGLLKPLEVFRHLTRQVRSKIVDVCTWTKGSFAWYAGRENHARRVSARLQRVRDPRRGRDAAVRRAGRHLDHAERHAQATRGAHPARRPRAVRGPRAGRDVRSARRPAHGRGSRRVAARSARAAARRAHAVPARGLRPRAPDLTLVVSAQRPQAASAAVKRAGAGTSMWTRSPPSGNVIDAACR